MEALCANGKDHSEWLQHHVTKLNGPLEACAAANRSSHSTCNQSLEIRFPVSVRRICTVTIPNKCETTVFCRIVLSWFLDTEVSVSIV